MQTISLSELIRAGMCEASLKARTKDDVLKEMVLLADRTGLVSNSSLLLESLRARESISSTALPEGVAFPHTKGHVSGLVSSSFVIVGRSAVSIPFGMSQDVVADVFFLPCSAEKSVEVQIMVRLFSLIAKTCLLTQLRACVDAVEMLETIAACERAVFSQNE